MPRVSHHPARYRAYRMHRKGKAGAKGMPFRKIIATFYVAPNNEYGLHATKGFRWRRLAPSRNELLEALASRLS